MFRAHPKRRRYLIREEDRLLSTKKVRRWLATPVDDASLIWFRVAFGLSIAWEMWRHITHGWVALYWIEPKILFPYWPFTFVRPWPFPWMMYAHVVVVGLAGLTFAAGWRYRASAAVVFFGFTWLFLLDQSRYLNHFYLISLLAFVSMWLPLNRELSLDVGAGRVEPSTTVPAWSLYAVRFMVGVPYFFGGVAKIGSDWLSGYPMRDWLLEHSDLPVVGPFLDTEAAVVFFSWGGLLFDLLIVPTLMWRRTRVLGLALMMSFHLMNSRLFMIGIFPWMMILVTLVFLPPDWPRRVWDDVRNTRRPAAALLAGALVGCMIGFGLPSQPSPVNVVIASIGVGVLFWEAASYGWDHGRTFAPLSAATVSRAGFACGTVFVLVQLLVPLRHLLIPGNVHWTEEGHRWSWHMKLRDKEADDFYFLVDPPGDGRPYIFKPRELVSRHQLDKVANTPEMIVLLAHEIAKRSGIPGVAVYARSRIRLNGRHGQPMVDPHQDLTKIDVPWWPPAPWILPLREPLPPQAVREEEE